MGLRVEWLHVGGTNGTHASFLPVRLLSFHPSPFDSGIGMAMTYQVLSFTSSLPFSPLLCWNCVPGTLTTVHMFEHLKDGWAILLLF